MSVQSADLRGSEREREHAPIPDLPGLTRNGEIFDPKAAVSGSPVTNRRREPVSVVAARAVPVASAPSKSGGRPSFARSPTFLGRLSRAGRARFRPSMARSLEHHEDNRILMEY